MILKVFFFKFVLIWGMLGSFEKLIINKIVVIVLIINCVKVKFGVFIVIKYNVIVNLIILFNIIIVSCWWIKINEMLIINVIIDKIIFNGLKELIWSWCIWGKFIVKYL